MTFVQTISRAVGPASQPHYGVAARIYQIRLALGDGAGKPLSMREFARLVTQHSGRHYGNTTISRLETRQQIPSLADVVAIAQVDPLKRGRAWLAFGEDAFSDAGSAGGVQ